MERDDLYLDVWRQFQHEKQLRSDSVRDRTKWPLLAFVGTPGSGKTRFIAEALRSPHAEVVNDFPHYIHIHATYNDGNVISRVDREEPALAFSLRLLYHHFVEGAKGSNCLKEMFGAVAQSGFDLSQSLELIREDYLHSNKLSPDTVVNIAVGVDEYSKWLEEDKELANRALKNIIESLQSTRLHPPHGVNFFFLLAGTSLDGVTTAALSLKFPVDYRRLSPLSTTSTLAIAQDVLQVSEISADAWFRAVLLDIGGHPRLLEQLLMLVKGYSSLSQVNWTVVSETLARKMSTNWSASRCCGALQSVIGDMIRRQRVTTTTSVAGTTLTYDQLEQLELGLRFDKETPYLPYLCLQAWLLHTECNSPLLENLSATIRSSEDDQFFSWQHFEVFCAQYLALKIAAWAQEGRVKLQDLLRGAKFGGQLDATVGIRAPNKDIGAVWRASNRFPKSRTISDNGTPIPWQSSGQVVLNKEGAPFDFFASLDNGTKHGFVICGQTKYYKFEKLTQQIIEDEYRKVQKAMGKAKLKHWMLLVLSTGKLEDTVCLPDRCAVVALQQFEAFFGRPFAERVHFWCK